MRNLVLAELALRPARRMVARELHRMELRVHREDHHMAPAGFARYRVHHKGRLEERHMEVGGSELDRRREFAEVGRRNPGEVGRRNPGEVVVGMDCAMALRTVAGAVAAAADERLVAAGNLAVAEGILGYIAGIALEVGIPAIDRSPGGRRDPAEVGSLAEDIDPVALVDLLYRRQVSDENSLNQRQVLTRLSVWRVTALIVGHNLKAAQGEICRSRLWTSMQCHIKI